MRYNLNMEITLEPDDIRRLQDPELGIMKRGAVTIIYNPEPYDRSKKKGKK